ncbi:DUF1579 domain-containing protein [candidate division KSB1 bacterium]|nr:DUF1579 domain-containing protein [candidate division KSB1 bacterium]NIR70556.1 DUF1579 domain-containing protein [candidate division KSB1 bacterium]NIS27702.1 DUF1579 domain-containing protein [candidate division KSB1 bacterium]NIT70476.1 DUF1579 domain-containing protein [candidate division KSB1 bacterium]NIU28355.1 DUF1579 domain-containing protein [candidate division KSB1 bacterium]
MKKLFTLVIALSVCFAIPLMAQEQEMAKSEMEEHAAPPPLDDEWSNWMVGEWEGTSEGPMGKSKDWMKCQKGLDGQFLIIHWKGKMDNGMTYEGRGASTIHPMSGKVMGYWIDSMRGMYEGEGKREGNKLTMEWTGSTGTAVRITEKISDDKFVVTEKMTMPDGSTMEGTSEMTRKKMASEK